MARPEIRLWQGMARYAGSLKESASAESVALGEPVQLYELKTIEDWKIDRIPDFTLALPGTTDKMGMCHRTTDVSSLKKVADIYRERKSTKLKFYKISENISDLPLDGTPIGYLAVTNQKGRVTTYEFSIEPIPFMDDPDGIIAFVDGSGGGGEFLPEAGFKYKHLYGGAYMLFKPGELSAFVDSENAETEPIQNGLKGIAPKVGNVYGEVNSAIMAIKRADSLGVKHLRLYYDCEQIGGHAPGGAYQKHDTPISKKYADFLASYTFASLKTIELVHVDGHVGIQQNEAVDIAAKRARDSVEDEYMNDPQKRALYMAHAEDNIA